MAFDTVGLRAVFEGGSSFISGVQNAARAEQDLIKQTAAVGSSSSGAASGINTLSQSMQQAERSGGGFGSTMKNIATTAAGFAVGNIAMGGITKVFGMAKDAVFGMNSQLETSQIQFETLFGDADKAREHVKMLFEFAKKTPFETQPIIEASRMLQTFGGDALNSQKMLTLVGDAAAGTTTPINELSFWVGRAYAAIKGGQPFGEAAARLSELAVLTPETRQKMEDLQKAGASSSEIFSLLEGDLGRFAGGMEKQAGTWSGVVSTFNDTIAILAATAFKPFFDLAVKALGTLNELLGKDAVVKAMQGVATGIATVLSFVLDKVIDGITKLVDVLQGPAEKAIGFFGDLARDALPVLRDVGEKLLEVAGIVADWSIDKLQDAAGFLADIGETVGSWALDKLQEFAGFVQDAFGAVDWSGIASSISDLAGSLQKAFMDIDWAGIGQSISDAFDIDWGAISQEVSEIGASFMDIDWASVGSDIADMASKFAKFIDLKGLLDELKKSLDPITKALSEEMGPAVENISRAMTALAPIVGTILVVALRIASEALQILIPLIANNLVVSIRIAGQVIEYVAKTIENAIKVITGILNIFIGVFTGDWERAWNGVKQVVDGVWSQIKNVISTALDIIKIVIEGAWKQVDILTGGKLTDIKNTVTGAFDTLKGLVQGAWDGITSIVTGAWDGILTAIDATKDAIQTAILWPFNKAKDLIGGIWGEIKSLAVGGVNGVIGVFNSFVGGIVDAVNWVLRALGMNEIDWNGIPPVGGGGGSGYVEDNSGFIGAAAEGGVAPRSGFALVGERGPELVKMPKGAQVFPNDVSVQMLKALAGGLHVGGLWDDITPDSIENGIKGIGNISKDAFNAIRDTVKDWIKKGAEWVWKRALDAVGWVGVPDIGGMFSGAPQAIWGKVQDEIIDLIWGWIKGAEAATKQATGVLGNPVGGPYSVSQEFGMTDFAASGAYGGRGHSGIDMAGAFGTPILAADGGEVTSAGWNGGYGNYIRIAHGALATAYGHLQKILVSIGQLVEKAEKIGEMGSTGYSSGSHLHFETYENGALRNPRDFVALADGGMVQRATLAMIGEDGPEAVVPLNGSNPVPVEVVGFTGTGPWDYRQQPMPTATGPSSYKPTVDLMQSVFGGVEMSPETELWFERMETLGGDTLWHIAQGIKEAGDLPADATYAVLGTILESLYGGSYTEAFREAGAAQVAAWTQAIKDGTGVANTEVAAFMETMSTPFQTPINTVSELSSQMGNLIWLVENGMTTVEQGIANLDGIDGKVTDAQKRAIDMAVAVGQGVFTLEEALDVLQTEASSAGVNIASIFDKLANDTALSFDEWSIIIGDGTVLATEQIHTLMAQLYDTAMAANLPESFNSYISKTMEYFVKGLQDGTGIANTEMLGFIQQIQSFVAQANGELDALAKKYRENPFYNPSDDAPPSHFYPGNNPRPEPARFATHGREVGSTEGGNLVIGDYIIQNGRKLYYHGPSPRGGNLWSYEVPYPGSAGAIDPGYARFGYVDPVKGYASGGMIWQKTLAWLGERGPEAVLPMSKWRWTGNAYVPKSFSGSIGGQGFTIDLRGSQFSGTPQENAHEIETIVRRTIRSVWGREAYLSGARL